MHRVGCPILHTDGRYKWVYEGSRLAAAQVDDVNDANTSHADIAEEYLGRPGLSRVEAEAGWFWLNGDVLEYETLNTSLEDQVVECLLVAWTQRTLQLNPAHVRRRRPPYHFARDELER